MYAAYQVDGPSPHASRATTLTKNDDQIDEAAIVGTDFHGRIVSYFLAGTLGLLTPRYLHASAATANWTINQIEFEDPRTTAVDAATSASRDIAHIRQILKISVTELARTFDVSRQAVHEWLKGNSPSLQNELRLSKLAHVADIFLDSGIDVTPQMLRRRTASGRSILESINEDGKAVELARNLVETLSREFQQRTRLAERLAERQKVTVPVDAFGAPHVRENT